MRRALEHPLGHEIITNHLPGLLMAPRKASTKKEASKYALKVIFGFLILIFQLFWLIINFNNCLSFSWSLQGVDRLISQLACEAQKGSSTDQDMRLQIK